VPSTIISINASSVSENGGKDGLTGMVPAISQAPNTMRNDTIRRKNEPDRN
jgi:hypothetical protein